MTVVFTRIATPVPGRLAEAAEFVKKRAAAIKKAYGVDVHVNARFGGPVGQVSMVSYHENLGQLEDIRRKIMADVAAGKIPTPAQGLFSHAEDAVWLRM